MTSSPADRPEPGTLTIGGYRLLTPIGEGGMGVVHLAEDREGRRVALKVLRPQVVGDDEGRRRLEREVASLRHVTSRHVAEVLDADPWGDHPFIVTRYVPGHSLHETVARGGPLPLPDLLHTGRGLMEAVRDVHSSGVLHRDLKPTNVVMEGRAPILIDFGLARLAEDPRLTATGLMLGTPGYLAPEVLFGDEATTATDVHGWAATTAYAATGRAPYGRGHTMAILDRTRRGEVDLDGAPRDLRALLAACLASEPLDRPTTAEALAALEEVAGRAAGAELPTAVLATGSGPPGAAPPDATMPWQLVAADEPPTDVLPTVPTGASPGPASSLASSPAPGPAPTTVAPVHPTVVAPTSIAPTPPAGPGPGQYPPPPYQDPYRPAYQQPYQQQPYQQQPYPQQRPTPGAQRLDAWGRLRRSAVLLGLAVTTVLTVRAAPYLGYLVLAVLVVGVRGVARTQESLWRRRAGRGRSWSDAPRGALGYPWHALVAAPVSLLLVLFAAVPTALVAGVVVLSGATYRDALLLGGLVTVPCLWWGPGSARLRRPVTQSVTVLVRRPAVGWLLAALALLLAAGLAVTVPDSRIRWDPAGGPPWETLRPLLPDLVRRWI